MLGACFVVFWVLHEAGRGVPVGLWATLILLGLAVGASAWFPAAAAGLLCLVVVLQLPGAIAAPDSNTWPAYFAGALVAFPAGLSRNRATRALSLPLGLVWAVLCGVAILVPSVANGGGWSSWIGGSGGFLVPFALAAAFVALWGLGVAVATLSLQAEFRRARAQLDQTQLLLRLEQDRGRIARDIHDSLAHALAVMVSQADGALAIDSSGHGIPPDSLRAISATGRDALTDLRALLERIGEDDAPGERRGAADIPELVERMRQTGMNVRLVAEGSPGELAEAQGVAVYRIVQESLTNALKHADPDAFVTLGVEWRRDKLHLTIASRGARASGDGLSGAGVGIAGMTERARLAGGELAAGPDGRGGFIVEAVIPIRSQHRRGVDAGG